MVQSYQNMLKISRIKTSKEATECARILFDSLATDFPYKKETIVKYQEEFCGDFFSKIRNKKDHIIFGGYDAVRKLMGFAQLDPSVGGVADLNWIIVSPEFRGLGVGSDLLKFCENWLLKRHFHFFKLCTESKINREIFYPRHGFKLVGIYENSWYGENEYIFAKHLASQPFKEVFKPDHS